MESLHPYITLHNPTDLFKIFKAIYAKVCRVFTNVGYVGYVGFLTENYGIVTQEFAKFAVLETLQPYTTLHNPTLSCT